ncbi:MAG: diguanylate cyclase, partial [Thermodesulfobacteriota bacterium]
DRSEYMLFTDPYINIPTVIIAKKGAADIRTLSDLRGRSLAAVKGYASTEDIKNKYPDIEIMEVPSIQKGLKMVSFDVTDAFVVSVASASYYIEKLGLTNLTIAGEYGFGWKLSFASRSDWPELNSILEKALADISPDERKEIFRRWVNLKEPPWKPSREFILGVILILTIVTLVLILFINRTLKKRVSEQTKKIRLQLEEKLKTEEKLRELTYFDDLTGVGNRRSYNKAIDSEWNRAKRRGTILSVIMVDIDYFKPYNDLFGHIAGDECLRKIAQAIKSVITRSGDLVARYGGEEFIVILPDSDNEMASKLAEKLREKVESLEIRHPDSEEFGVVTISLGVATMIPKEEGAPDELVSAADNELYKAKKAGRNCIKVFHDAS